jgi:hypothetical protein
MGRERISKGKMIYNEYFIEVYLKSEERLKKRP